MFNKIRCTAHATLSKIYTVLNDTYYAKEEEEKAPNYTNSLAYQHFTYINSRSFFI